MAVRLADYTKNHIKRIRRIWTALVFINTGVFFVMLYLTTGQIASSILLSTPIFVLQIVTLLIVLPTSMTPIDVLSRAIVHVSGQANDVIAPNVNGTMHEKTGLKDMIDVVYRLATTAKPLYGDPDEVKRHKVMVSLMENLPFGVIGLTNELKVRYYNKNAPVLVDERGNQNIHLMFEDDNSLSRWVTQASTRSLSESKQWQHIQSALPGSPGRKIYDVFAQYTGNDASGIETVLITMERTGDYAQSEEEMDFISLAAHELRGPITIIHGYLDVLQEELGPTLQPEQIALFERLQVSASRLTGYVNNVLNAARYDRRHLTLSLEENTLANIYRIIQPDIALRASTQNRLLQVAIPDNLPTIAADKASLSEVMANIIDNAIKYSHEGGLVAVTAAVDGNFVKCSVQDNGIGMPAAVVSSLFKKFYRSHRSDKAFSGTGLGLYISKAIIESHGGSIGVRSKEGEGSVFTFSVPIYSTVADKLAASGNSNSGIISSGSGWIKNHAMFKG